MINTIYKKRTFDKRNTPRNYYNAYYSFILKKLVLYYRATPNYNPYIVNNKPNYII